VGEYMRHREGERRVAGAAGTGVAPTTSRTTRRSPPDRPLGASATPGPDGLGFCFDGCGRTGSKGNNVRNILTLPASRSPTRRSGVALLSRPGIESSIAAVNGYGKNACSTREQLHGIWSAPLAKRRRFFVRILVFRRRFWRGL